MDARSYGIPIEQLLEAVGIGEQVADDGDFAVWQDNVKVVKVFLACETQWKLVPLTWWSSGGNGMTGNTRTMATGLDYSAVESVMRMMRIGKRKRQEIFEGVHIMEQAALEVINARK